MLILSLFHYTPKVHLIFLLYFLCFFYLFCFEFVKHDGNCKVQEEIVADQDTSHKEENSDEDVVPILNHKHDICPTFKSCALENGQVCSSNTIKICDAEIVEN